jgi:AraC-like DNA-binding protein
MPVSTPPNMPQTGAAPPVPPTVLACWHTATTDASATTVLPDGCSDLILHLDAQGQAGWHISPLADAAIWVPGHAGELWRGYRLQPGTTIDASALLRSVQAIWKPARHGDRPHGGWHGLEAATETLVLEAIDLHTRLDPRAREALHALAHALTVGGAARALGVSERSLERLARRATGQPPRFWRGLARVRNAARQLGSAQPLAEIAADHGYADQAHFSRECLRWLGAPPSRLRQSPALLATVAQAGYG